MVRLRRKSGTHSTGRVRVLAVTSVAALIAAILSLAPPAQAAGGAPTITDAYVPNARYAPGTAVTVSAVVHESSGAGSWSGNVTYTMTHLGNTVSTGSVPATIAANGTASRSPSRPSRRRAPGTAGRLSASR